MMSTGEAVLAPSWMLRLVRELGDVGYARLVDETRISRWVVISCVLDWCWKVGENKARPNQVELERTGHIRDNILPLFLLIVYIVTSYSTNALHIYLTCLCVTGRGHMPCRRSAVIDSSLKVRKRHRHICRDVERGIGRSLRGCVTLDRAGGVEGLIPKGAGQS